MKIGKNSILREEDQQSILSKVSDFHVSANKIGTKGGINAVKTAVDVL